MPSPITRIEAFDKSRYRKYISFEKSFEPVHRLKQLPNTTNEAWNGKDREKRKERLWGKNEKPRNIVRNTQLSKGGTVKPSKKAATPSPKEASQPAESAPDTTPKDDETPLEDAPQVEDPPGTS